MRTRNPRPSVLAGKMADFIKRGAVRSGRSGETRKDKSKEAKR